MRSLTLLLSLAALLPAPLLAQTRSSPADSTLTEPDQELDDFSGRFNGTHHITTKVRGVRAANKTVYWVGADGRQLSAFKAGKHLWTTDVAAPFKAKIPAAHIASITLATTIIFVKLAPRGMAEVERETGRISSRYFDRDPNKLVPEPK